MDSVHDTITTYLGYIISGLNASYTNERNTLKMINTKGVSGGLKFSAYSASKCIIDKKCPDTDFKDIFDKINGVTSPDNVVVLVSDLWQDSKNLEVDKVTSIISDGFAGKNICVSVELLKINNRYLPILIFGSANKIKGIKEIIELKVKDNLIATFNFSKTLSANSINSKILSDKNSDICSNTSYLQIDSNWTRHIRVINGYRDSNRIEKIRIPIALDLSVLNYDLKYLKDIRNWELNPTGTIVSIEKFDATTISNEDLEFQPIKTATHLLIIETEKKRNDIYLSLKRENKRIETLIPQNSRANESLAKILNAINQATIDASSDKNLIINKINYTIEIKERSNILLYLLLILVLGLLAYFIYPKFKNK